MSYFIDIKYLGFISSHLRNFKQTGTSTWRCSCPLCGDSKTNELAARCYIFRANEAPDGLAIHCHNCAASIRFHTLLKLMDPRRYKEYVMETFEKPRNSIVIQQPEVKTESNKLIRLDDIKLPNINQLPAAHHAVKYINLGRMIPQLYWSEIFYTDDYKQFLDSTWPDHGKDNLPAKDARLVLFYTNRNAGITNVSGRSLNPDSRALRYLTVKVSNFRKVYGLHRVDLNQPIYVVEGQFDSMFLNNAVASGDSNLAATAAWMQDTYDVRPTLVFDKEPRNRQIVKQVDDAIDAGWSVCLLPEHFPGKDINEAIMSGMSAGMIHAAIDLHTYSGLNARLQFTKWRKC